MAMVLSWRNHEDIRSQMYSPAEISAAEHLLWFGRSSAEAGRQLMIFEVEGEPRGFVSLGSPDAGGNAFWGFYAAPAAPKGTGRLLGEASLDYAFNVIGLRRICGEALASNLASIGFHRSLGFKQVGGTFQKTLDGSRKVNIVRFELTAEEFRMSREK